MSQHKWNSNNIENQKGRVAIVTGSSSGIGYETAGVLANKKATVIIAVRNLKKGNIATEKIKAQNAQADVRVMELDLADLNSVCSFSDNFKKLHTRLDLLINNAGVMVPPYSTTTDGYELQFGTNYLGHFALTGQLFNLIRNTPMSRIVNVSSNVHKIGSINFEDLNWEKRKYNPIKSYGDSKIANIYLTYELARRIDKIGKNPVVAASHPGWTATELQRHAVFFKFLINFFAQDITMGALPTLYAAVGPDVKGGDYFGPSGFMEMRGYSKKVETNTLSKDINIAKKLWDVSEELTGVKFSLN